MTLVVDVDVGVGAGAGPAGVSMCPANTETAGVILRNVAALSRRKVFTSGASYREFFTNLVEHNFSCKSLRDETN